MKKETKAHADATAAFERRTADLETAKAKLAAVDPDDAARWSAAHTDVLRLEAAAARAAKEAAGTAAALAGAQRTALERELAEVEARLAPSVLEARLAAVRQRAFGAVREMLSASIDLARAVDANHADVTECERLHAELGTTCEHRRADYDRVIVQLAEQLREDYRTLRCPRDLVLVPNSNKPKHVVSPGWVFPRGDLPPLEDP